MILQFNLNGLKRQPNESSLSKTTKRDVFSNTCPPWTSFWSPWPVCSLPSTRQWKLWQWANSINWRRNNDQLLSFLNFPELNLALRSLPTLAHDPPAHIKASFELVSEEMTERTVRRKCRRKNGWICNIFYSSHLENPIAKKLLFPIKRGTDSMQQECG